MLRKKHVLIIETDPDFAQDMAAFLATTYRVRIELAGGAGDLPPVRSLAPKDVIILAGDATGAFARRLGSACQAGRARSLARRKRRSRLERLLRRTLLLGPADSSSLTQVRAMMRSAVPDSALPQLVRYPSPKDLSRSIASL